MNDTNQTRALIVVFDALRPEFVTPELMPNLHAFAAQGVRYSNSRSTYPSETRVNQSAVTTGCYPRRHGVVANRFVVPGESGGIVLDTGDDIAFEKALKAMPGPMLESPTLGQRLAAAGRTFAALSAGTAGGGRIINIMAEETGGFRLAMRRPEAAHPAGVAGKVIERVGPIPAHELPAIDWITWAVDAYLGYIETDVRPDVMLLWLCEPDESFHQLGIGSPDTLRTIAHADAQFGRILAQHANDIDAGRMQIITLSDHGQISLKGNQIDLQAKFATEGFGPGDVEIVVANAGGVWLRKPDELRIAQMAEWLQNQDWCGPVFTRDGVRGTLTLSNVLIDHARAPDIALALGYDDTENDWGRAGMSLHDSKYPEGGGCHGGLSKFEMHNFLALSGSRFNSGRVIGAPAGNVDILPTLLHLFGIDRPENIDGRVLAEALEGSGDSREPEIKETTLVSTNDSGAKTHLSLSTVAGTPYVNRAWVE